MVMPTMAIALVRFSSVVRSATSARITEPTAPAPCSARPKMTPPIEVDIAATALPMPNRISPKTIMGLRPNRSDSRPKGICNSPWRQPVDAQRLADQIGGRARKVSGIGGKHRIDHEQAEQPDREDRRERAGGPEFLSFHRLFPTRTEAGRSPERHGSEIYATCPAALRSVKCRACRPPRLLYRAAKFNAIAARATARPTEQEP